MNYWIFTAAPHNNDSERFTARQVFVRRLDESFWGLGTRTPNRMSVRKGDHVVFYVARPESAFAGTARLASDCFDLTAEQKSTFSRGSVYFTAEHGVFLETINRWGTTQSVETLAEDLQFIKNRMKWWCYLQGGIRRITERDYATIVRSGSPGSVVR